MYGGFDYNNTIPGVQWTALWYRDGKLMCHQTESWKEEWSTGGYGGYTECADPIGGWQPGQYEVQIFMGYEWEVIGRFIVIDSPNGTPTFTPVPPVATP